MSDGGKNGEVRGLWGPVGAERPEDALKRLNEALANEEIRGVILTTVKQDGACDTRVFGEVLNNELTWTGTQLVHEAHR